jgi:hypothetical protein
MSSTIWTTTAVASEARHWEGRAWRIVEAQHGASTMKLVDGAEEQALLERLLETSKPPPANGTAHLHYLLATPFRYSPRRGGSRFRDRDDPGVFYGAESVRTACMEMGYWRWRFLMDAPALGELVPLPFTAFATQLRMPCVDLRAPPFDRDALAWKHPQDYGPTQSFARIARDADVGGIVYTSVRDRTDAWCVAVLQPGAFVHARPEGGEQTWWLRVTQAHATWRRDDEAWTWSPPA